MELLLGLLVSLLAAELFQVAPWLAKEIVRAYARKLPEENARLEEEWLAIIYDTPGSITKLWVAIDLVRAVFSLRKSYKDRLKIAASITQNKSQEKITLIVDDPVWTEIVKEGLVVDPNYWDFMGDAIDRLPPRDAAMFTPVYTKLVAGESRFSLAADQEELRAFAYANDLSVESVKMSLKRIRNDLVRHAIHLSLYSRRD